MSEQQIPTPSAQKPPSILPVSHDILKNKNTTSLDGSGKELSKLHGGTSLKKNKFWQEGNGTQRGMQSRHLTMIGTCSQGIIGLAHNLSSESSLAIGGTIGTGIFLSAGIVRFIPADFFTHTHNFLSVYQGCSNGRSWKCHSLLFCSRSIRLCCCHLPVSRSLLRSHSVIHHFLSFWWILSGEMSSMYPVSGAFSTFGTRFVSPALGFTLGTSKAWIFLFYFILFCFLKWI